MKRKLTILAYISVWVALMFNFASSTFPSSFHNPAIDPTQIDFWVFLINYFNRGGTIAWELVLALWFWSLLLIFGSFVLFMKGADIIPAIQKYRKEARPLIPKKRPKGFRYPEY